MTGRRRRKLWQQLQGEKPHFPHFLSEIRLQGIRGLADLEVGFEYPVSVIAGSNASGKSTILFAAACAYKVPGAGVRDFAPSTLFPDYRPQPGARRDHKNPVTLEFNYKTPEGRMAMRWRRNQGWSRSFLGRKNASQPERQVYLRAPSNPGNPSEARGAPSMPRLKTEPLATPLNASQIAFAQPMLPFKYSEVVKLSSGEKNMLFAEQEGGVEYSELHMAAGERALLRISQDIAQLRDALVLIDEVEAGLHPWIQQMLMLQLQQLALRNDLQVIVTTHSPVVLDTVPAQGRIFLERDETGRVAVHPPYRDIVQDVLYGRSSDTLNLLCEDDVAEGILQGIVDEVGLRRRIGGGLVRIGRNTGAEEFPTHATAFKKFGQIENFVFVLDGDKQNSSIAEKIQEAGGKDVPVLFLPGDDTPEAWVWQQMQQNAQDTARELSINKDDLINHLTRLNSIYDSASDSQAEIAKNKLYDLSENLNRNTPDICRIVSRLETRNPTSKIQPLTEELENTLITWRDQLE